MLILTRKTGQSIRIGDDIEIEVLNIKGRQVRIGINAPGGMPIHREEIFQKIRKENLQAASMPEDIDVFLVGGKKSHED